MMLSTSWNSGSSYFPENRLIPLFPGCTPVPTLYNGPKLQDGGHSRSDANPREREARQRMWAVKGLSMEKWLCWGSMGTSGFLLLLFLLDVVLGIPFGGISVIVDIFGILACGMVLYLGWDASRDLR